MTLRTSQQCRKKIKNGVLEINEQKVLEIAEEDRQPQGQTEKSSNLELAKKSQWPERESDEMRLHVKQITVRRRPETQKKKKSRDQFTGDDENNEEKRTQ